MKKVVSFLIALVFVFSAIVITVAFTSCAHDIYVKDCIEIERDVYKCQEL